MTTILTVSRELAKILTVSCKSYHPIETFLISSKGIRNKINEYRSSDLPQLQLMSLLWFHTTLGNFQLISNGSTDLTMEITERFETLSHILSKQIVSKVINSYSSFLRKYIMLSP